MTLRGIQEYIAKDVNNIARVEDEGDYRLPFCHRTKAKACGT